MTNRTSEEGVELIKEFEAFRAKPYLCSAGVWTNGYGNTTAAGNGPVGPNTPPVSEKRATQMLMRSLAANYEPAVRDAIDKPNIPQEHFDAMVSLCYNIGPSAFKRSSVARRYNAGNIDGAGQAFLMWVKANGRTIKGLVRRREEELKLYESAGKYRGPSNATVKAVQASPTNKLDPEDLNGNGLFDLGDRGQAIRDMQTKMITEAPAGDYGVPDGIFGPKTKNLVMAWQEENDLVADGVVGPKTKKALSGD